jgi:nucleoid-associated protein YgaU
MLSFRTFFALVVLLSLSGCGMVHFGRLPESAPTDTALSTAYSNLSTEHKMLKQELALSRKEGDALRAALENREASNGSPELVARLNETTRELTALRASYAKLSEAKAPPAGAADTAAIEEKLAVSLRNYTALQEENARLRSEVARAREENSALTAQVKTATAQNQQAQAALAQLNSELLAQKEARARAEQQAAANAAQLTAVIANVQTRPATLADAREVSANGAAVIAAPPTAELRTSPNRIVAAVPTDENARIHVVTANETLEKIALKYYGDSARWRTIYFANSSQLSGGRPLKPGMKLEIPRD